MSNPRITGPLFKWFGSKWNAAKHYPNPKYNTIIEPFSGSAGYALHYCEKKIIIAESNPKLFNLWKWLIEKATEQSIREIPINLKEGTDIRKIGLQNGQALLLKHWQRTNNLGNCWTVSPWGNKPGQWTENTRARIANEFHYIKHWYLTTDAFTLFQVTINPVTWFIDPPYQFNYQYASFVNYKKLAENIKAMTGQLIVCEARAKSGEIPSWLPFKDFRETVTSRRKPTQNHHSKELIWTRNCDLPSLGLDTNTHRVGQKKVKPSEQTPTQTSLTCTKREQQPRKKRTSRATLETRPLGTVYARKSWALAVQAPSREQRTYV